MKTLIILLILWIPASVFFLALWHAFVTRNRHENDPDQ